MVVIRLLFRFLRGSFYLSLHRPRHGRVGADRDGLLPLRPHTIPESHRYAIEFELFLALALMEAFRLTLRSSNFDHPDVRHGNPRAWCSW